MTSATVGNFSDKFQAWHLFESDPNQEPVVRRIVSQQDVITILAGILPNSR